MANREKADRRLRNAKNAVRGAFNKPRSPYVESSGYGRPKLSPADLILGGFSQLDEADSERFLDWINGFPTKAVPLYPNRPIESAGELRFAAVKIHMPLLARLNWLTSILENSRPLLSDFLARKAEFEIKFLLGLFGQAHEILEEIRKEFGLSVWYIENMIAVLQRWKGLDAQKEFARTLSSNNRGSLAGVAAYWISQRNEDNTVLSRFRVRMERAISNWNVDQAIRNAYSITLGAKYFEDFTSDQASAALGALATSSLIDAYNAAIHALSLQVSERVSAQSAASLAKILARLPEVDRRVMNLKAFVTGRFEKLSASDSKLYDRLCAWTDEPTHPLVPTDASITALVDRAYATGQEAQGVATERTPLLDLSEMVEAATSRGSGFETRIDQGLKQLANLRDFPIATAVRGYVALQDPDYIYGSHGVPILFFVNSDRLHLLHSLVLPAHQLPHFGEQFGDSSFAPLLIQCLMTPTAEAIFPCVELREVAARQLIAEGKPEEALAHLQVNQQAGDAIERRRLSPLLVEALYRLGKLDEAISITAWICANDIELATLLPLKSIVDDAKAARKSLHDHLSLSIVLDVYLDRYDDDDAVQLLKFVYEDYVLSQNVEVPSQLPRPQEVSVTSKLIYFLAHVALPEVMDVSFWRFKTSKETWSERIAVLSALIELDPFDESVYRDEIKDITKLLNIQDGLEDVDRSRVYVNVAKLIRWGEIELREPFDRYQALLRAGVKPDNPSEFDKVLKDYAAGKGTLDKFADYPDDEAGQLLLDMYRSAAEKYLHDADIGLDAYLSMRIRHGSLGGHIRGPLEEQGLLAVRDKGTNRYRTLRMPPVEDMAISESDWAAAKSCIEEFSRKFDSSIDTLTKEYLQIKSEAKPAGLFAFDPPPLTVYYLRANIDEGSPIQHFLLKLLDALNVYLSVSLQNVRKYITETFRDQAELTIEAFRSSVQANVGQPLRGELHQLVARALPDLQAAIERVAGWFASDAENERRALRTMDQIVDIAIQATNNAHRGFEPVYEREIEDLGLQSNEVFIEFTDIMFTVLDNIYIHSGLDTKPVIKISITMEPSENSEVSTVSVLVENRVSSSSRTHAAEKKLNRIREQMESGDYRARSKGEGGSGLLKLKRLISLDDRQSLDFGYRPGDDMFFVHAKMKLVFSEYNQQ